MFRAPKLYIRSFSQCPDAKITNILDDISKLNIMELSMLIDAFKKRHSISDISVGIPVSAAAPQSPSSSTDLKLAASQSAATQKTEFSIFLKSFEPTAKAKVIKEIKAILPSLNLVEAKSLVESAPKLIKDKVKKEETETIKKALESVGAVVSIE